MNFGLNAAREEETKVFILHEHQWTEASRSGVGVMVTSDLKCSQQCEYAYSKANSSGNDQENNILLVMSSAGCRQQ